MIVNQDYSDLNPEELLKVQLENNTSGVKAYLKSVTQSFPKYIEVGTSILNGIIGDYLEKENNDLRIEMGFYYHNQPVPLESNAIKEMYPDITSKICILVHGLCANEFEWKLCGTEKQDYGERLQNDLGYTPLYLRYNSGLHISENGKKFSTIISTLIDAYPIKVDEIIFICHSLGGLITRSACNDGKEHDADWTNKVKRLFFLASPHLGAPFERFGNILTYTLKAINNPVTQLIGDIINLRSNAIKDLRYGYIKDEDWKGYDPDELLEDNRNNDSLFTNAEHYNIAASLTENPEHPFNKYIGDPLVTLNSAFGKSEVVEKNISFPKEGQAVFPKTGHINIANCNDVYKQIYYWCGCGVGS